MFRGGRGPRPLPPYDGRVTKAATHTTTRTMAVPPASLPSRAWIGDCADSALLEDYFSGSDRDDYPAAPVEAPAPLVGSAPRYATDSGSAGGGVGGLPFSYANEMLMLPLDAAAAGTVAAPASGPSYWPPPALAKVEPPDSGTYGMPPSAMATRPGWERDAGAFAVTSTIATAAVRGGGGGGGGAPMQVAGPARPMPVLSPVAALSPLAGSSFDPRAFFEPLELAPSTAEPSEVTGVTVGAAGAVADPDGAHLHKRELADPPYDGGRAGGVGAPAVDVEAASSSGGSYVEARVSPTTLTAVSRRVPTEAADHQAVSGGVFAARRAGPGVGYADGERRLEWDKAAPPPSMYWGGEVGGVMGLASSPPQPTPPPVVAAVTTATANTTRGAAAPISSAVAASGHVPASGGSGSGSGGAGGSSSAPPPPAGVTTKPKRFACDQCGQLFTERSNRKKHVEAVHLKLRPHGCATCGAEFAAKVNLHKHILSVHDKARPFPCGTCGAAFGERNKRDKHTRTVHGGERPWACDACGHAFGQRSDLVRHAKIVHEGVRPHACPQPGCDKSFGRRGSLVHHLAVIHKVTSA